MSLWSTFYCGETQRIAKYITSSDFKGLDADPEITAVDFSGGVSQPFLFPADFDHLFSILAQRSKFSFREFKDVRAQVIWGDDNENTAEHQAFTLNKQFLDEFGRASDNDLLKFSKSWNEKRQMETTTRAQKSVASSVSGRILKELTVFAIPIALTIGMLQGPYSPMSKVLVPVSAIGLFLAFRTWIYTTFQRRKVQVERTLPDVDWVRHLQQMKNLCKRAKDSSMDMVYMWSL